MSTVVQCDRCNTVCADRAGLYYLKVGALRVDLCRDCYKEFEKMMGWNQPYTPPKDYE